MHQVASHANEGKFRSEIVWIPNLLGRVECPGSRRFGHYGEGGGGFAGEDFASLL